MKIIKVQNTNGGIELYFEGLGHWDYVEPLINRMVQHYECHVIKEKDMITDKDVTLKYRGIIFLFRHHYMFGNYLYTEQPNDIPILEKIANDVIRYICRKLKS